MAEHKNEKDHTVDDDFLNQLQPLSGRIKASARQVWLAGLGALTKAEDDAGKLFEKLVNEGEQLEDKTRSNVKKQIKAVEGTVEEVKTKATDTMDKLEAVFDQRVSKAMSRLGIPSRKELVDLQERVALLERKLESKK